MAARVKAGASQREGLHSTPSRGDANEAALQTFKKGAILINSAGYVAEAAANPALGTIIGVAEQDGQNNATAGVKTCRYVPALPHVVFEMSMDDGTGTRVTVVTDRYEDWGITKDADGKWYVDSAKAAANQRVRVVDFLDPIGTAAGRVLVQFLNTATIYS